jgi:glycosyltransferase involved in cell wall biosynthesis
VPSYGHARYLAARIDSIVRQSYPKIDITVIDDGSPDDSDKVLKQLEQNYRFTYIRRDRNSGSPFASWRYAAETFRDGLIWICESDDFAEPDFVARGVEAFNANPNLALFYCNSWVVDEAGERVGSTSGYFEDFWKDDRWKAPFINSGMDELAHYQLRAMTVPNMSSALMRHSAFQWAFRPRTQRFKLAGDWLLIGELMRKGDVAFTPDRLNNYRRHSETVRARTDVARSQAEYMLIKYRLHLRVKKPALDIARTLNFDLIRFLEQEATASDIVRQMLAISWADTLGLACLLGLSLAGRGDVRRDLARRRAELLAQARRSAPI